jgi:hypothetical protein
MGEGWCGGGGEGCTYRGLTWTSFGMGGRGSDEVT